MTRLLDKRMRSDTDQAFERRLATLRDRVRVVTLHGFGGAMPPSYELVYHERVSAVGLNLALWVQHAAPQDPAERA